MTDRLTRTERAACELALGVLRREWRSLITGRVVGYALEALRIGNMDALAWSVAVAPADDDYLRARLALYLRALLRADRGDCGPWRAGRYDTRQRAYDITRRIRPLWQVAGEARREVER